MDMELVENILLTSVAVFALTQIIITVTAKVDLPVMAKLAGLFVWGLSLFMGLSTFLIKVWN